MPKGSNYYVVPRVVYHTSGPTVNADSGKGLEAGQIWVNTTTKERFICHDNAVGAAKWYQIVDYAVHGDGTVPSMQTEINNAVTNQNIFMTPEVCFYSDGVIGYDLTVPANTNAMSVGPMSIDVGYTVTVDGIWTVV